jgi:hypothetical protein
LILIYNKIIKQLFHACSGNNQNYCRAALEMTWKLLPSASVLKSSPAPRDNSFDCSSRCWGWLGNCCLRPQATVLKSSPARRVNSFDCSLNRHEITVYHYLIVKFCMFYKVFFIFNYFWGFGFLVFYCLVFYCLKEIQHFVDYLSAISSAQRTEWSLVHLTGMTHCTSFSGMEQFGSGSRGTVNCFTPPAIFKIFL